MKTIPKKFVAISRVLRKNQTPWEHKLWRCLRANRFYGIQFKRQVRLGNYIVDFYSASKNLVIELDGSQHSEQRTVKLDEAKEEYLKEQGYRVLRFWNNEIDGNLEGILERIKDTIL